MSSCTSGPTGGRRRRHTKKQRKTRRSRRRTVRGGMFASANGVVTGASGQPAGMEYGGVLVSGASPVANTGQVAGRRRSRRSRRRMRGGDASTNTGGEGRGGLSAGFQGTGVAGTADHVAVSTRA